MRYVHMFCRSAAALAWVAVIACEQPAPEEAAMGGGHDRRRCGHERAAVPSRSLLAEAKFTSDGAFLMQIGEAGKTRGRNNTEFLGHPADIEVDPETNEAFVADGYLNKRVIVFDAETGEYKRHWGAYGNVPDDAPIGRYAPDTPISQHFADGVHGLRISKDGLVYVADRGNGRIQIFQKDGAFRVERSGILSCHRMRRRRFSMSRMARTSGSGSCDETAWRFSITSAAAAAPPVNSTGSTKWPWTPRATSPRVRCTCSGASRNSCYRTTRRSSRFVG